MAQVCQTGQHVPAPRPSERGTEEERYSCSKKTEVLITRQKLEWPWGSDLLCPQGHQSQLQVLQGDLSWES